MAGALWEGLGVVGERGREGEAERGGRDWSWLDGLMGTQWTTDVV